MTCVICHHRPAETDQHTCFGCSNAILRDLREIEDCLPSLSLFRPVRGESRRAPGFSSQSPAHDDAIVHTDPRSVDGAAGILTYWAHVVTRGRGITAPPPLITLLRQQHAWITQQDWVGMYAGELRQIRGAVRVTAGDPIPKPVGRCITVHPHGDCNGPVHEREWAGDVQCARCHRVYDGLDLIRLRTAQDTTT